MPPLVPRAALVRLLLCLTILGCAARNVLAQEAESRKYALLVGVREYDRNQLRSLPYPENDVVELAEVLKQSGFRRVVLLTQTEGAKTQRFLPLAKNVRASLMGILEDRTVEDLVLIAFAGHGVQFQGEEEHFFCPMDAVLTDRSSLVPLSDVYQQLELSKAGTKLLIVDACRNDPLSGNARAAGDVRLESVTRPQRVEPPGGVAALFSCSAGQRAFEDESLKHGVFFHHVILGLKGDARPRTRNEVTWDNLVAHVKREVPDTVKDLFGDTYRQIPENKGKLRGAAALVSFTKPTVAETVPKSTSPASSATISSTLDGKLAGDLWEANGLKMKFRWCPAGTFTMGSPKSEPNHSDNEDQVSVTLSRGLWMAQHETTQGEWQSVMGTTLQQQKAKAGPNKSSEIAGIGGRHPMYFVNHDDATRFCVKLTESERRAGRLPIGWEYRLPTEAQWEYACRAGTTTATAFGSTLGGTQANFSGLPYNGGAMAPSVKATKEVGSYKANAWGLYDMHGNVWEWCVDWYEDTLAGGTDPEVSQQATYRVYRGGSWDYGGGLSCRSARRFGADPTESSNYTGFRAALVRTSQ